MNKALTDMCIDINYILAGVNAAQKTISDLMLEVDIVSNSFIRDFNSEVEELFLELEKQSHG